MKNLLFDRKEKRINGKELAIARKRVLAQHPLADLHLHEIYPWLRWFEKKHTEEEVPFAGLDKSQRTDIEQDENFFNEKKKTISPKSTQGEIELSTLNPKRFNLHRASDNVSNHNTSKSDISRGKRSALSAKEQMVKKAMLNNTASEYITTDGDGDVFEIKEGQDPMDRFGFGIVSYFQLQKIFIFFFIILGLV